MRWKGRQGSDNVEDRRGRGGAGKAVGGLGIGGIIIAIIIMLLGGDPSAILQGGGAPAGTTENYQPSAQEEELAQFVSVVLKDTEDVWEKLFPQAFNRQYRKPTLVLFSGSVQSACGMASSATGPFYCPGDYKVYIDLSFYNVLKDRFKASGDFAMAYVVAHEVGHHIQRLLGITDQVDAQRGRVSKSQYNDLSVRLELQADFLAGVWAHHAQKMKNIMEEGDLEEALSAANAIGDDNIQKQTQGYIVPDSFTHGTSEQRMRWFRKGFETGDLSLMDTFSVRNL